MDPFTGISLAASVVQLIDFGIKAAKTCHGLYEHGSSRDFDDVEIKLSHLDTLTESLKSSLPDMDAGEVAALSKEEKEMRQIALKCEDCSGKLRQEVSKLRPKTRKSSLKTAKKFIRASWKRREILRMQEKLESWKSLLESSLLNRLNIRLDAEAVLARQDFTQLSADLQRIIISLARGETSLAALISVEHEQTRQHSDLRFDHLEQHQVDDRHFQEIRDSLFYPEIFARQEQVEREFDGIEDSYQWIFDDTSQLPRPSPDTSETIQRQPTWDSLVGWLKHGKHVYWINGKAGSGKSTLMHFICDSGMTKAHLEQWSGGNQLLTPSFFFWNAGVQLQKCIEGLLRSLILQMLTERPTFITSLKALMPASICIFVDGLDEFDGSYTAVLELIGRLSDRANVKLCLSSRPFKAFEDAFKGGPTLKLQDLTFKSIQNYAKSRLDPIIEKQWSWGTPEKRRAIDLLHVVVERAEGVFLWAVIVVRKLKAGLEDLVDLDELKRDIELLPSGIERLYHHTISKIGPAYQRDAVRFLFLIFHEAEFANETTLDLYRLFFISEQRACGDTPLQLGKVEDGSLVLSCHRLKTQLMSHTRDFLDIAPAQGVDRIYGDMGDQNPVLLQKVRLFHKSAKDFLLHNALTKSLREVAGEEAELRLSIARGILSQLNHLSQRSGTFVLGSQRLLCSSKQRLLPHYELLEAAISHITRVEILRHSAQSQLMQSLQSHKFMPKLVTLPKNFDAHCERYNPLAYVLDGPGGTLVDIVAMAARSGMTRYVCDVLDIPTDDDLTWRNVDLAQVEQSLHADLEAVPNLILDFSSDTKIDSLHYRQQMNHLLRQKSYSQALCHVNGEHQMNAIVESYLLHCISSSSEEPSHHSFFASRGNCLERLTLVGLLLNVGAHPMMQLRHVLDRQSVKKYQWCFWKSWMLFMNEIKDVCHQSPYEDDGIVEGAQLVMPDGARIPFKEIYDMTKLLLRQGAQPSYKGKGVEYWFQEPTVAFRVLPEAMCELQIVFRGIPEFPRLIAAFDPSGQNRWERIELNCMSKPGGVSEPAEEKIFPNGEECKTLWPLIDSWTATGGRTRHEATLKLAIHEICKIHILNALSSDDCNCEEGEVFASVIISSDGSRAKFDKSRRNHETLSRETSESEDEIQEPTKRFEEQALSMIRQEVNHCDETYNAVVARASGGLERRDDENKDLTRKIWFVVVTMRNVFDVVAALHNATSALSEIISVREPTVRSSFEWLPTLNGGLACKQYSAWTKYIMYMGLSAASGAIDYATPGIVNHVQDMTGRPVDATRRLVQPISSVVVELEALGFGAGLEGEIFRSFGRAGSDKHQIFLFLQEKLNNGIKTLLTRLEHSFFMLFEGWGTHDDGSLDDSGMTRFAQIVAAGEFFELTSAQQALLKYTCPNSVHDIFRDTLVWQTLLSGWHVGQCHIHCTHKPLDPSGWERIEKSRFSPEVGVICQNQCWKDDRKTAEVELQDWEKLEQLGFTLQDFQTQSWNAWKSQRYHFSEDGPINMADMLPDELRRITHNGLEICMSPMAPDNFFEKRNRDKVLPCVCGNEGDVVGNETLAFFDAIAIQDWKGWTEEGALMFLHPDAGLGRGEACQTSFNHDHTNPVTMFLTHCQFGNHWPAGERKERYWEIGEDPRCGDFKAAVSGLVAGGMNLHDLTCKMCFGNEVGKQVKKKQANQWRGFPKTPFYDLNKLGKGRDKYNFKEACRIFKNEHLC
ncbi:uncharacterized protein KY384_001304 [Bacidia gigantensis]|uniref:uncharacterized protein n=1 Tax=Bacidia gigantensis TaxID=2732470 RepID=UPI001D04E27D|nr:uncharacterized protein KY384_001304 [Bacidia gigantensis]KAG8533564.1 hypothetical protein KY384_001304 [Bacidia gigantensis]